MSRFTALCAALLSGSAAAAEPPATTAPANASNLFADIEGISAEDQASLTAEVGAALTEVSTTQRAAGFKAANERAVAVMSSDKAKAAPGAALALLGNEKLAALSADEIIASIPEAPAAAPAATTTTTTDKPAGDGGSKEHQQRLEAAPQVALGNKGAEEPLLSGDRGKGGAEPGAAKSLWGNVQDRASNLLNGGPGARVQPAR